MSSDHLVSTAEAAKAIGVGVTTLQRWAKNRTVTPAVELPGRGYRWDVADLRRQLAPKPKP